MNMIKIATMTFCCCIVADLFCMGTGMRKLAPIVIRSGYQSPVLLPVPPGSGLQSPVLQHCRSCLSPIASPIAPVVAVHTIYPTAERIERRAQLMALLNQKFLSLRMAQRSLFMCGDDDDGMAGRAMECLSKEISELREKLAQ